MHNSSGLRNRNRHGDGSSNPGDDNGHVALSPERQVQATQAGRSLFRGTFSPPSAEPQTSPSPGTTSSHDEQLAQLQQYCANLEVELSNLKRQMVTDKQLSNLNEELSKLKQQMVTDEKLSNLKTEQTKFVESEVKRLIEAPGPPEASPGPPEASPGPPEASPGPPEVSPGPPETSPGPPETSPGALTGNLKENTFSFLIAADKIWSVPFETGLFVFFFKNVIFGLLFADLLDPVNTTNPFDIPAAVPTVVLASQFFAFLISVLTQGDLVTSQVMYFEGCPYDVTHPEFQPRKRRWILAVILLFIDGAFGVVITFLLVVTSETVLEVLLNFAAVEFVATLDESAFFLASHGFFGEANLERAQRIKEANLECAQRIKETEEGSDKESRWKQTLFQLLLLAIVLGGWCFVISKQRSGEYLPMHLLVQFDDEFRPDLAPHSGYYKLEATKKFFTDDKFRYVEERYGGGSLESPPTNMRGEFVFCREKRYWVFLLGGDAKACNEADVQMKSAQTFSYNLLTTASDQWFVQERVRSQDRTLYSVPMDGFYMAPGCTDDQDCGGTHRGSCRDEKCSCNEEYKGLFCSVHVYDICPTLAVDDRFSRFPSQRSIATKFYLFENGNKTFYGRPIYIADDTQGESKDAILFTGLRWALLNATVLSIKNIADQLDKDGSDEEVPTQARNVIEAVDFLSAPVPIRSAVDQSSIMPVDLLWHSVVDSAKLEDAELSPSTEPVVLICTLCNNQTNQCSFDNHCDSTGSCMCAHREVGPLCQMAPLEDGHCDSIFNSAEFDFDGGDCCEGTCRSSPGATCGIVIKPSNMSTVVELGFPLCQDPKALPDRCLNGHPCYVSDTDEIDMVPSDENLYVLGMSGDCRIILLLEPEPSHGILVFRSQGNEWVQLGNPLGNPLSLDPFLYKPRVWTGFGSESKLHPIFVTVPSSWVFSPEGKCCFSVYKFSPDSGSWEQIGTDLCSTHPGQSFVYEVDVLHECDLDVLHVCHDSEAFTTKALVVDYENGDAHVFTTLGYNTSQWSPQHFGKVDVLQVDIFTDSAAVSMSGDGRKIVSVTNNTFFLWFDSSLYSSPFIKKNLTLRSNYMTTEESYIINLQLSYDGTGLSVSRVSRDGIVSLEWYNLELSAANRAHGTLVNQINTTVSRNASAVFSPSGDAWFAVDVHEDLTRYSVFRMAEGLNKITRLEWEEENVSPIRGWGWSYQSLSDGGMEFAFWDGAVKRFDSGNLQNLCGSGTEELQVFVRIPKETCYSRDLLWNIGFGLQVNEEHEVIPITLPGIPPQLANDGLAVTRRLCVPADSTWITECLQIQFLARSCDAITSERIVGYAAFKVWRGQSGVSMSEMWSGEISPYDLVDDSSSGVFPEDQQSCISIGECDEGNIPFVLVLGGAYIENGVSWSLRSNTTTQEVEQTHDWFSGKVYQACLSSTSNHSLIVQNLGRNTMVAFFGGKKIAQQMDHFQGLPNRTVHDEQHSSFAETDALSTLTATVDFDSPPGMTTSLQFRIIDALSGNVMSTMDFVSTAGDVYDGYYRRTKSVALPRTGCYNLSSRVFESFSKPFPKFSLEWGMDMLDSRKSSFAKPYSIKFGNCVDLENEVV